MKLFLFFCIKSRREHCAIVVTFTFIFPRLCQDFGWIQNTSVHAQTKHTTDLFFAHSRIQHQLLSRLISLSFPTRTLSFYSLSLSSLCRTHSLHPRPSLLLIFNLLFYFFYRKAYNRWISHKHIFSNHPMLCLVICDILKHYASQNPASADASSVSLILTRTGPNVSMNTCN